MTKRTLLVLLILLTLAFASYAAWQQTKTALAVGVIASPSGDGTFRVLSATCYEVIPGEDGWCHIRIENLSSGTVYVDDFSVTVQSGDVVIDKAEIWGDGVIGYRGEESIQVDFHAPPDATPGAFVFEVSVTCSGG